MKTYIDNNKCVHDKVNGASNIIDQNVSFQHLQTVIQGNKKLFFNKYLKKHISN